jgi:hypothetical protein
MLLPDQTYEQANTKDILTPFGQLINEDDEDIIEKKLFIESLTKVSTLPKIKEKLKNLINVDIHSLHNQSKYLAEYNDDCEKNEADGCCEEKAKKEEKENEKNVMKGEEIELSENYERTSEFFNNIPEYDGEALGPFSVHSKQDFSIRTNVDLLKACELFLSTHRIRPDFFCKYRNAVE